MSYFGDDLDFGFKRFSKGNKVLGIIVSVLMVLLGVVLFLAPLKSLFAFEWIACIGLFIFGVVLIIRYFTSVIKNGWALVNGIINIVISIWILVLYLQNKEAAFGSMTIFIALLFAFTALSAGIGRLELASAMKKSGASDTGIITASGVLDIIFAALLIIFPYSITFIGYIIGIYLIIGGITLFAESCST